MATIIIFFMSHIIAFPQTLFYGNLASFFVDSESILKTLFTFLYGDKLVGSGSLTFAFECDNFDNSLSFVVLF